MCRITHYPDTLTTAVQSVVVDWVGLECVLVHVLQLRAVIACESEVDSPEHACSEGQGSRRGTVISSLLMGAGFNTARSSV